LARLVRLGRCAATVGPGIAGRRIGDAAHAARILVVLVVILLVILRGKPGVDVLG
jgi:hypothetical protein